jgi:hypothetical protein
MTHPSSSSFFQRFQLFCMDIDINVMSIEVSKVRGCTKSLNKIAVDLNILPQAFILVKCFLGIEERSISQPPVNVKTNEFDVCICNHLFICSYPSNKRQVLRFNKIKDLMSLLPGHFSSSVLR